MMHEFSIIRCALLACALTLTACGTPFDSASTLSAVRILGIRSDTPYVRPGALFTAEVLAYDGRDDESPPMRLYWLDDVCVSPAEGKTDDCYRQFEAKYPRNEDLTPLLTEGERANFVMPDEVVSADPQSATLPVAFVFVAACAGHLELVGSEAGFPGSVPFACVDQGHRLDENDFVFGFMRLYVSSEVTNKNPSPSGLTLDGASLPLDQPRSIPRCTATDIDDCPARKLEVTIGDDQQEIDPTSAPPGGDLLKEQIWSNFFVSSGKLESESLILFDARHGRASGAANEYRGPNEPGEVDLFVVTHDNRSGVAFQSFRLSVE